MNILVSGTSKGIGKELALYYLSKGHNVIGVSRTKSSINKSNYMHFEFDITQNLTVLIKNIKINYKIIDVLINNAGIASMNHFLLTTDKKNSDIMNLNYNATFNLTREIVRLMYKSQNARIINFSTVAVSMNLEGEAAYASSKAAVETLTRILAKELSSYKITVNCIAPAPLETDLIKNVPKDKISKILNSQAIKRLAQIDDITNVLDFFISKNSNMISGQVIKLGGVN